MSAVTQRAPPKRRPRKNKKSKKPLKIVIRLLPPALKEEIFWSEIDKYVTEGSIEEKYYVEGHYSKKPFKLPTFSRAYILFKNNSATNKFLQQTTDIYFSDETGDEMRPEISHAVYNKMANSSKRDIVDSLNDTLKDDPVYQMFLKVLEGEVDEPDNYIKVESNKKKRDRKKDESKRDDKRDDKKASGGENKEASDRPKGKSKSGKKKVESKSDKEKETFKENEKEKDTDNKEKGKEKKKDGPKDKSKEKGADKESGSKSRSKHRTNKDKEGKASTAKSFAEGSSQSKAKSKARTKIKSDNKTEDTQETKSDSKEIHPTAIANPVTPVTKPRLLKKDSPSVVPVIKSNDLSTDSSPNKPIILMRHSKPE